VRPVSERDDPEAQPADVVQAVADFLADLVDESPEADGSPEADPDVDGG
jgi:hypothetical protein